MNPNDEINTPESQPNTISSDPRLAAQEGSAYIPSPPTGTEGTPIPAPVLAATPGSPANEPGLPAQAPSAVNSNKKKRRSFIFVGIVLVIAICIILTLLMGSHKKADNFKTVSKGMTAQTTENFEVAVREASLKSFKDSATGKNIGYRVIVKLHLTNKTSSALSFLDLRDLMSVQYGKTDVGTSPLQLEEYEKTIPQTLDRNRGADMTYGFYISPEYKDSDYYMIVGRDFNTHFALKN
jgi:hypothetical protein